ncbi:MAG: preprotein translocase subunit SecE [Clostridia bacterium]|nr:preprotein translocase subunit SecE [Clostridia bacterium]
MAEELKDTKVVDTAAPSDKKADKAKDKKKSNKPSLWSRIKTFFRSYKAEMKKIVWSRPKQVFANTLLVLVCMIAVAAVIALLDFLFQHALSGLTSLIAHL